MSRFAYEEGDISFINSIEGVIKNGKLVKRPDPFDRRKREYKVIVNGIKEEWYSSVILTTILRNSHDLLSNISIKNMKLNSNDEIVPVIEEYKVVKITEKNINILKQFVDKYLKEHSTEEEYMNYGYSNKDYFMRMKRENFKSFIKSGFMGLHNDKIETLFIANKNSLNILMVHTVYGEYSEDLIQFVERLSSILKNSVFYYEYYPNSFSQSSKMKIMSHNCSFDKDRSFMFYHGVYLTEYDENLLPKMVEKIYFPEIKLNELEIKCVKASELETYFSNMRDRYSDYQGYWKNKYNNVAVAGFTYLHSEDFHANYGDIKYLVALYQNRIVGVIKFGIWPNSNHQALSYIDVSVKYRRLGIATRMIKELNKYITNDTAFVLTDESEMGKLCGMNEICKKYITKTKIKTYKECLRDGHYN